MLPVDVAAPAMASTTCRCVGFRLDGSEFKELCTIPGGFGNVSAEYWSALHSHHGFQSLEAARRAGAAEFVQSCTAAAAAHSQAGSKLYAADAAFGSLRSSFCNGEPWTPLGTCFACHCLAAEMAPGEGSIARRLETRRKRGSDAPSKFARKRYRSEADAAAASRAQEASQVEAQLSLVANPVSATTRALATTTSSPALAALSPAGRLRGTSQ